MKNPTKPANPVGLATTKQNADVVKALMSASKGFKGALGHISSAAQLASKEFSNDKSVTAKQKVDAVIATYAPTFALCDNNVKQHFTNCLWLLVAPDAQLEISPPKGKAGAVTMRASDVVANAGKHTIQALAKEARDANGAGRKVSAKVTKKPASFYDLLAAALNDKDQLIKIKLTLASAGYALTPIAKLNKAQKVDVSHIVPVANKITDVAQVSASH